MMMLTKKKKDNDDDVVESPLEQGVWGQCCHFYSNPFDNAKNFHFCQA